MIKKRAVFVMALGLCVFIGGLAFAQSCPDVVGEWDVTGEQIYSQWRYHEETPFEFEYRPRDGVIEIVEQRECLFHGWVHTGDFKLPLVGTINNRNIIMVSGDAVTNAKLRGYNRDTRLFTIMNITAFDIIDDFLELPPEDTFMSCGQGTAIRR
jgi:hypothetical protein